MDPVKKAYLEFCRTIRGVVSYAAFRTLFHGELDPVGLQVASKISGLGVQGDRIRICDIGSGTGLRGAMIAKRIAATARLPTHLLLIEQSERMMRGGPEP